MVCISFINRLVLYFTDIHVMNITMITEAGAIIIYKRETMYYTT
jgi:hypothetical protein